MKTTPVTPVCGYCNHLVGDAEYDIESGYYDDSHYHCVQPVVDGRFTVVTFFDGEQRVAVRASKSYTHLTRADEVAEYLASTNRCRWYFRVWDGQERRYVANHRGNLPEAMPDGTPRYDETWTVQDHLG